GPPGSGTGRGTEEAVDQTPPPFRPPNPFVARTIADPGAESVASLATWEIAEKDRTPPPRPVPGLRAHLMRRPTVSGAVGLVRAIPRATVNMLPMWVMHRPRRHERDLRPIHLVLAAIAGAASCAAVVGAI